MSHKQDGKSVKTMALYIWPQMRWDLADVTNIVLSLQMASFLCKWRPFTGPNWTQQGGKGEGPSWRGLIQSRNHCILAHRSKSDLSQQRINYFQLSLTMSCWLEAVQIQLPKNHYNFLRWVHKYCSLSVQRMRFPDVTLFNGSGKKFVCGCARDDKKKKRTTRDTPLCRSLCSNGVSIEENEDSLSGRQLRCVSFTPISSSLSEKRKYF